MKATIAATITGVLLTASAAVAVDIPAMEQDLHNRINNHRSTHNLPHLQRDYRIDYEARKHAETMAVAGRLSHDGFSTRLNNIKNQGLTWRAAAENVAYNCSYSDPNGVALRGWLNSSGHHRNIDGSYTLTGIGISYWKGCYWYTQMFIRP